MEYNIINEKLGLACCSVDDLTMSQVQCFLKQWEPGASIGGLILFYDEEKDLIVLNSSNTRYQSWRDITEDYLSASGEDKKELRKRLDEHSRELSAVLDRCEMVRTEKKETKNAENEFGRWSENGDGASEAIRNSYDNLHDAFNAYLDACTEFYWKQGYNWALHHLQK